MCGQHVDDEQVLDQGVVLKVIQHLLTRQLCTTIRDTLMDAQMGRTGRNTPIEEAYKVWWSLVHSIVSYDQVSISL